MSGLSIPGRLAKLEVSESGLEGSFINYGGIVDIGMNISIDELECTSHDSVNGAREWLPNFHDVTMDVSGRWHDGDPGQEIMLEAVFAKTRFHFRFYMKVDPGSGLKRYDGLAFATGANPSGPLDDTGAMDVTLRCSGVLQVSQ